MEQSIQEIQHDLYFCVKLDSKIPVGLSHVAGKLMCLACTAGHADVLVGKDAYVLDESHFLFLHPHAEITLQCCTEDFRGYAIGFVMGIQESDIAVMDTYTFAQLLKTPCWALDEEQKVAIQSFCRIFYYINTNVPNEFKTDIVASYFSSFLKTFYALTHKQVDNSIEPSRSNSKTLALRFMTLLNNHYREDHRVAYYAEKLCVSAKYLTQVVKEVTTVTPKTMIDRKLAIEALYQLRRTSNTIQEISFYLGFPDQSYFGRFFKRIFEMSPLAYRMNPNLDLMQKLQSSVEMQSGDGNK